MLTAELFTKGENETQDYYFFKNEVTHDLVQIIKNKVESHFFGLFMNHKTDNCYIIPVYSDPDPLVMLEKVSEWYNSGMPRPDYSEPPKAEPKRIADTLTKVEGIFGHNHEGARRIQAYIDDPSVERWDDINGVIIRAPFYTVWQSLLDMDPSFPKQGRTTDITGKVVSEWARIPTEFELLKAIKIAVGKQ